MWPNATASSTSTDRLQPLWAALRGVGVSWRSRIYERYGTTGGAAYILVWTVFPLFSLATVALIYRGVRPELVRYAVVGTAAGTFIVNALFYIGQMLDEERLKGTLAGLFLTPCPRFVWLTGFALGGLFETGIAALSAVLLGVWAFGVRFDPNYPALAVSFLLFLLSLWGLGFVFSALGLILKRSNDLANFLSSFLMLLGGVAYPVALLPLWLRVPARALPLGYGTQALADAALKGASIESLAPQLLPLTGFAVVLPCVGVLAFAWLERKVRRRGELDLY